MPQRIGLSDPIVFASVETIAEILGGLGIFFFALHFLSQNLQQLASHKLRQGIAKLTSRTHNGMLFGAVMITVTQSGSASVFLMVGLVRAGLLTLKQAQPVLLGVNLAAGLTVLFLTLEIHSAIMIVLAVSGIAYVYGSVKLQRLASAALGIGLLFLGLQIMRDAASSVEQQTWFASAISFAEAQPMVSFVVGAGLTIVTQSSMAVVVVVTTLLGHGTHAQSEVLMFIYGTNVGASVLTYILSSGITGVARQVALYQVSYNLIAAAILVPLYYVEVIFDVPLVAALVTTWVADPKTQIAVYYILFNFVPVPFLIVFLGASARVLKTLSPETEVELGAKPQYLQSPRPEDPSIAFRLIGLEQRRMVDLLMRVLHNFRDEATRREIDETLNGFETLAGSVRLAIEDVTERAALSPEIYDQLDCIMRIQNSLEAASRSISKLTQDLDSLRRSNATLSFPVTAVEGLDMVFHLLSEVAQDGDVDDIRLLSQITSDKGNGIKAVRAAYLSNEEALQASDRVHLLAAANHCERLIWLAGEACDGYRTFQMA